MVLDILADFIVSWTMVLKIFMESISTVKEATNLKKKTKNVFFAQIPCHFIQCIAWTVTRYKNLMF